MSELQEALSTSTHDVQMVLNYLEARKDLDMNHVGMYGQGSGGAIAILAAATDPRITALNVTDPWGDWPDWLKGSKQIPEEERATYLSNGGYVVFEVYGHGSTLPIACLAARERPKSKKSER